MRTLLKLDSISLLQYRNYTHSQYTFPHKVTGICGPNGIGKTNLLDAIYYLCFTKSYFSGTDSLVQQKGSQGFRLEGHFTSGPGSPVVVTAILRENGKKEIAWNGENYGRLSGHVGRLPLVIIAPDDVGMITGGSEERRRLLDGLLCQLYPEYLQQLMEYNKLTQQRNSLLKQMNEAPRRDFALLEILDQQLASRGLMVWQYRRRLMEDFLPQACRHYQLIAGGDEAVSLVYESALNSGPGQAGTEGYLAMLHAARPKDLALQRTTAGVHRDDLSLLLDGQPFRQTASQGQRKSMLFALKLTEYEWLQQHKGFAPILLLDDVFEKLDHQRMTNLLREVCVEKEGQVFITDTHYPRLQEQLTAIGADYHIITLD